MYIPIYTKLKGSPNLQVSSTLSEARSWATDAKNPCLRANTSPHASRTREYNTAYRYSHNRDKDFQLKPQYDASLRAKGRVSTT